MDSLHILCDDNKRKHLPLAYFIGFIDSVIFFPTFFVRSFCKQSVKIELCCAVNNNNDEFDWKLLQNSFRCGKGSEDAIHTSKNRFVPYKHE